MDTIGWIVFAALWEICGLCSLVLGWERGRFLFAFLLAGWLGPILLVILAILPSRIEICPACLSRVPAGASLCRYCRTQFIRQ